MSIYPRRNFLIRSELYSSRRARVVQLSLVLGFRRFTILNDGNRDRISSPVAKTDLLHSFLPYCVFFLPFFSPPESFFASLCIFLFCPFSLPLFLSSLITVSRHTTVPLAATSIKLPAPPAVADSRHRRRRYPRTRAYRRSHVHTRAHTGAARLRFASGRHTDGYGCHAGSAALHSLSLLPSRRPAIPFALTSLWHALHLIHSFPLSLSRQLAVSFQGCRQ